MKRISIAILLLACGSNFAGCSKPTSTEPQPAAPSASPSSSASANSPDTKPTPTAGQEQGPVIKDDLGVGVKTPGGPSKLVGTYTIAEVHEKGVVTMIPHQIATEITFIPDGTFSRISKAQGKANFKDSGQFIIEGQDQLVLKIVMSRGNIQQPPVEKRHTFSLSEDGDELRMTAKDGKVAVFRR